MNSAPQSDYLNTFRMSEETENAASFRKTHEAEIETITCSSTTLDVFCVLEDSKCKMSPEPHDDASSIENKASEYLSDLIIQMTGDLRYFVSHPQHGNNQFENVSGMMTIDFPSPYTKEELQEVHIATSNHSRRS
ncbi:hypothetical protein I79_020837 [Cricetulus griseus]|uniref:Uncharacterized protein n=1 Tax=Cricetulus griseus TaxID=10029 RepID=G3IB48_CRIGR|nr:hypothetical protein I79_020837 [Cricetulus griseus]